VKQTLDDFRENTIGGPGGRLQLSFQMYTYNARALAGLEGGMDCIRAQNLAVDALQRKYGDAVKVYDVRRDLDRPVGGPVEHHILGYQLPGDTKIYGYDPIMNRHLGVVGEVRNGEPQPSGKTEYIVPGRAG
jgi:hypothetical protein